MLVRCLLCPEMSEMGGQINWMFTSENVQSQDLATSLHCHHTHAPLDICACSLALCLCGIPCVGSGRPHPHSMDIALTFN